MRLLQTARGTGRRRADGAAACRLTAAAISVVARIPWSVSGRLGGRPHRPVTGRTAGPGDRSVRGRGASLLTPRVERRSTSAAPGLRRRLTRCTEGHCLVLSGDADNRDQQRHVRATARTRTVQPFNRCRHRPSAASSRPVQGHPGDAAHRTRHRLRALPDTRAAVDTALTRFSSTACMGVVGVHGGAPACVSCVWGGSADASRQPVRRPARRSGRSRQRPLVEPRWRMRRRAPDRGQHHQALSPCRLHEGCRTA